MTLLRTILLRLVRLVLALVAYTLLMTVGVFLFLVLPFPRRDMPVWENQYLYGIVVLLLFYAPVWGQQIELSWPTNYGQVTVEESTNGGYNWAAIATGEFTNIIIDATNQQNASTLQFNTNGNPVWSADCTPYYQFRVWWNYTQQEVWVAEQSWPNNTGGSYQPAIPAHWVWDNITSTITITRYP